MKQISKEMITATALDLFKSKGYDQVTIQDICASSGITKPTFYHYVESKESLILDLYDQVISIFFSIRTSF
jgi:AcrR family transcriptional regulator